MNKYRFSLGLAVLALWLVLTHTLQANSTVTIKVPHSIDILEIDGQAYQAPSLAEGYYLLELTVGEHALVAQYYENWNTIDDSGNLIKWKPVVLSHNFQASKTYQIQHFQPADVESAEARISSPEVWLDANNKTVEQASLISEKTRYTPLFQFKKSTQNTPSKSTQAAAISFDDWKKRKAENAAEYQRFREHLEYQEYLQFLEYQKQQ